MEEDVIKMFLPIGGLMPELRNIRKSKGMSIPDVAEQTGIKVTQISNIEQGKTKHLNKQFIKDLCALYDIEIGYVVKVKMPDFERLAAYKAMKKK